MHVHASVMHDMACIQVDNVRQSDFKRSLVMSDRIEHDWDALFDGLSARDIRTMLTDILQGDAGATGTLEGLQERLADRVWHQAN